MGLIWLSWLHDVSNLSVQLSNWLSAHWDPVVAWVNVTRPKVDPIVWIVSILVGFVPGTFAIYKWLYYRRSKLPQRFEEMLLEEEYRLKDVRVRLIRQLERPESIKPTTAPIFLVPALARALRALGWVSWWKAKALNAAESNLQMAISDIDKRLKGWDENRAHHLRQKAAAFLLSGAIAAANAEVERAAGRDGAAKHRVALNFFLKALEIDSTDIEALEYVGHQYRILGDYDSAIERYEQLAELANKPSPDMQLVKVHALRYQGELFERKYDVDGIASNLGRARKCLSDALDAMPQIAHGELVEAFIYRWLGSTEDKRNTAMLWRQHYDKALNIFSSLIERGREIQQAEAGAEEVKGLRERALERRQVAIVADVN